jgi:hypothetical protein
MAARKKHENLGMAVGSYLINRMANFAKLSENVALGHTLWNVRETMDGYFQTDGMGEAIHNVVSLTINVYRNPKLRKKLEALIAQV